MDTHARQEEVDKVSADVDKVVGMLTEERAAFEAQLRAVQADCVAELGAVQAAAAAAVQRAEAATAAAVEGRAADRSFAQEQVGPRGWDRGRGRGRGRGGGAGRTVGPS